MPTVQDVMNDMTKTINILSKRVRNLEAQTFKPQIPFAVGIDPGDVEIHWYSDQAGNTLEMRVENPSYAAGFTADGYNASGASAWFSMNDANSNNRWWWINAGNLSNALYLQSYKHSTTTYRGVMQISLDAGAYSLTIDSNSKVGMGTLSPVAQLDVIGDHICVSGNETVNSNKANRYMGRHYNGTSMMTGVYLYSSSADNLIHFGGSTALGYAATYMDWWTAANNTTTVGSRVMRLLYQGWLKLGYDATLSNSFMNRGLQIDQGGYDNEILCLRSSTDVAHGITNVAETDVYGDILKVESTGGLRFRGFTNSEVAVRISSYHTTDDTGKSTSADASIDLIAYKKSGAGTTAPGSGANLVEISSAGNARFIFDQEGDIHCDAGGSYGNSVISGTTILGYNTYDEFDDVQLVRALDVERNGAGLLTDEFDEFLKYNRDDLERLNIATFNDGEDEDGSIFINYTALSRLHNGAIWQLAKKMYNVIKVLEDSGMDVSELLEEGAIQ